MGSFYAPHGAADLLSRYSFLEPLLSGRRVLELGAARLTDGASALALAERGAAAVLSVEDDGLGLGRAAELSAHAFVQFRAAALEDLPHRAFDLVLVADGASLAASPERLKLLAELLSPRGYLVTAIAAPGARGLAALAGESPRSEVPSYESFAGALAAQFDVVEMATQSAAVGWVIAPEHQGDEAPDLGVDGALSGAPEAAYYLALCGSQPTRLSGMVLVTLPHAPLAETALAMATAARAHAGCAVTLAGREAELARLAAEASEREARAAALEEVLEALRAELDGARRELAAGAAALSEEQARRATAAELLAGARADAAARGEEVATLRSQLAAREAVLRASEGAVQRLEAQVVELEVSLRAAAAERERTVTELAQASGERAQAERAAEDARGDARQALEEREAARAEGEAAREDAARARAEAERAVGAADVALDEREAALVEARSVQEAARREVEAAREAAEAASTERAQATGEAEELRAGLTAALARAEGGEGRAAELEQDLG